MRSLSARGSSLRLLSLVGHFKGLSTIAFFGCIDHANHCALTIRNVTYL